MLTTVIPAYEPDQNLLIEAIFSALEASATEVIVVYDHNEIPANAPDMERVRITKTGKERSGPSVARNIGISLSETPITSFLDADDCYIPSVIRHAVNMLSGSTYETIYVGVRCERWPDKETILEYALPPGQVSLEVFSKIHNPLIPIVRTNIAQSMRYHPEIRLAEDALFNALLICNNRCLSLSEVGYLYRIQEESLSHSKKNSALGTEFIGSYEKIIGMKDLPDGIISLFKQKIDTNKKYIEYLDKNKNNPLDFQSWTKYNL